MPTVLLVTILPAFSAVLTRFAKKLTDMENYETEDGTSPYPSPSPSPSPSPCPRIQNTQD